MMTPKRDRGKNFTELEKEQLINICFRFKNTLENKKTDKISVAQKNQIWEIIKDEYNVVQTTGVRDIRALKILYDNLRMKARKERGDEKEVFGKSSNAGSCPIIANMLSSEPQSYPSPRCDPLRHSFDSNGDIYEEGNAINLKSEKYDVEFESNSQEPIVEVELQEPGPSKPKKKKPLELYDKLPDLPLTRKVSGKLEMFKTEHEKKMLILNIEEEIATVKLQNALKKQKILDLQLEKLLE